MVAPLSVGIDSRVMGMTPEEFLEAFVEGNLQDFCEHPGDIRRGFNSAVSASHLVDHYFNFAKRHDPNLVDQFPNLGNFVNHVNLATDGRFRDVRSVSNVYKHLYTDTGPHSQYSVVNSCGSIASLELECDEAIEGLKEDYVRGEGQEGRARVVVTRKDGTRFELLPALESVVDYLRALIHKWA